MAVRLPVSARALIGIVVATGLVAGGAIAAVPAQAEDVASPATPAAVAPADPSAPAAAPAPTASTPAGSAVTVAHSGSTSKALAYAQGKGAAADLHGAMGSLYRGRWYSYSAEKNRLCIARRESHSNYRSGAGSYYQGAYQFSRSLGRGAAWMMLPEVRKEMGAAGERIVTALRSKPVASWNRYWQDRAFFTIWRNGSGRSHWSGYCWKSPAQKRAEAKARAIAAKKAAAHRAAVKKAAAKKAAAKRAAAKKKAAAKHKASSKASSSKQSAAKQSAAKRAAAKKAAAKKAAAKKAAAAKRNSKR